MQWVFAANNYLNLCSSIRVPTEHAIVSNSLWTGGAEWEELTRLQPLNHTAASYSGLRKNLCSPRFKGRYAINTHKGVQKLLRG